MDRGIIEILLNICQLLNLRGKGSKIIIIDLQRFYFFNYNEILNFEIKQ